MRSRSKAARSERKRSPDLIIFCDLVRSVARVALSRARCGELNIYMQSRALDITRFDSDLGELSFL